VQVATVGGTSGKFSQDQYTYVTPQSPPVPTTASGSISVLPPPSPPVEKCVVPKLKGLSLARAKSALADARCKAGKVTKPRGRKGPFAVKSSKPGEGASLPAGSEVELRLGSKPNKRGRK
jgi:hypothetical protein